MLGVTLLASRALAAPCEAACTGTLEATLYLIGDAGAASDPEPVLDALARDAGARAAAGNPAHIAIAFLGDNLYPHGLPPLDDRAWPEARRRLEAQLAVLRATGVRGRFVPGNHDWGGRHREGGWDRIRRFGAYLDRHAPDLASLHPGGGCPGPDALDLGDRLRLVFLDSHWWLHRGPRPLHPESDCPTDSEAEVVAALEELLARAGDRRVVAMAHHPLRSGGPHGGTFPLSTHLFPMQLGGERLWLPLPGIGSLVAWGRQWGASDQDVGGRRNRRMRGAFRTAFAKAPPLLYASGHDHSLQVLASESLPYLVVSGAGNAHNVTRVHEIDGTLLARSAPGYMRLEALVDGRVRLVVVAREPDGGWVEPFAACLDVPCEARSARP